MGHHLGSKSSIVPLIKRLYLLLVISNPSSDEFL